ncbi:sigma-E factor negative regulatory protein RseA [Chromohalobacter marismortui]|uniref:Sigma-E factor negative regulatory protein RseA n=1 Tax=Chromohalobacter marismortui TaxID=42055 RepID=A0A4R7NVN1_9GAMM|nr:MULTISPECIES: sigma-E factor negative regulatory protein [Chromohalobacter]MCI0510347.1 sigma-E factor negative regulatory protein [Chromohalobacter sp.]MCI0593767.1 sigma-E factor negative regulatory protein [Chromohalobacter sp.]TDU25078.1 sigma-E factor negative regulatory protein RseA [Chromohalobacter marismortui]
MNQNVRESLSALMDNEGDDLEMRRVMKSLQDAPDDAETWRRYHLARSMMQRDRSVDVSTDLSAGIMARLAEEPGPSEATTQETRRSVPFSFAGSTAVAAAVSLMVITGVQVYNANTPSGLGGDGAEFASDDASSGALSPGERGASVQPASLQSAPSGIEAMPASFGGGSTGFFTASSSDNPVFPNFAPPEPSGVMEVSMGGSLFSDSLPQTAHSDYEQSRLLQAYLKKQHADAMGDAWMSSSRVPDGTGAEVTSQP